MCQRSSPGCRQLGLRSCKKRWLDRIHERASAAAILEALDALPAPVATEH